MIRLFSVGKIENKNKNVFFIYKQMQKMPHWPSRQTDKES